MAKIYDPTNDVAVPSILEQGKCQGHCGDNVVRLVTKAERDRHRHETAEERERRIKMMEAFSRRVRERFGRNNREQPKVE